MAKKHTQSKTFIFLVVAIAFVSLFGCAKKEECYKCERGWPFPDEKKVCGKGQDLSTELSWYRTSGYECAKVSSSSRITDPTKINTSRISDTIK